MHPNGEWGTATNHGFTGHEQLDETYLTHMNGRVYDYRLGRFLSVDPLISNPASSQAINPYSYIGNNPMSGTDPSGYCSVVTGGRMCGIDKGGGDSGPMELGGSGPLDNVYDQSGARIGTWSHEPNGDRSDNWIEDTPTNGAATNQNGRQNNTTPGDQGAPATIGMQDGQQRDQTTPAPGSSTSSSGGGISTEGSTPVHLALNIRFVDNSGHLVDNALTKGLIGAAEKTWSGTFGEYSTTANFRDSGARVVTVLLNSDAAGGISVTPSVVGQFQFRDNVRLFTEAYNNGVDPAIRYTPQSLRDTFAHEVGHVLGSGEQFNEHGPFPGHERDIMGVVGTGNKTVESTIREILSWRGLYP
jgi:RHS repeat-associated protein